MKDSYDPLEWNNGSSAQGYDQYSQADYDSYAQNPTYRSDFYEDGADQQYDYDQGYDASYDQSYDQGYDNGYEQGYDNSYDQTYYDDGSQQTQQGFYDPNFAPPPTQYSQADYDRFAQNPTYHSETYANKMNADEFFAMIDQQKKREQMKQQMTEFMFMGSPMMSGRVREGPPDISKDTWLYILFLAFGAAITRLINLPLWVYPMTSTLIAYLIMLIKTIGIDSEPPKSGFKKCIAHAVLFAVGIGFSIFLYAKGF